MGPMNGLDEGFVLIDVEDQNRFNYELILY